MALLLATGGLTAIIPLILMIAAVILFGIATFWNPPTPPWNKFVAAGLFCWALAVLIQMAGGL